MTTTSAAKRPAIRRRVLIGLDLLGLPFAFGPGVAAWTAFFVALDHARAADVLLPFLVAAPLALMAVFLSALFLLRLLIPRPRPGRHPFALSRDVLGWYLHLALSRAPKVSGLRYPLVALATTRWLMLRALGGRIAFTTNLSLEFTLVDLPLLEIGPGTTLGEHAYVGAHLFRGDLLILEPVRIGAGVFVGGRSTIGPGTVIDDGAWIGFGNNLAMDHIPAGARLRDCQWWFGSPARARKSGFVAFEAQTAEDLAAERAERAARESTP